jgi:serine/threonine protein kinase
MITALAEPPTSLLGRVEQRADPVASWTVPGNDPVMVGAYRLVSRLGSGGMADVFSADTPAGHRVVIKILRESADAPPTCRREFRLTRAAGAEVTTIALHHGVSATRPYLVTSYFPEHRCATELAGDVLPPDRLWALGSALSRALATIHARGVVHCDVKPANLLIHAQDVRLIDFGIARYVDEPGETEGPIRCSPGWAAPEQRAGEPVTPAVDVFAWGCVLAYLATGIHPATRDENAVRALALPSTHLPAAPAALQALIRAAMAPDPLDRPTAHRLAGLCADAITHSS